MSGYRVETATNGREALEAMRRERPQLLILDLMMPEMDGFEVEHRLRLNPNWHEIPVLLMTARDLTNEERAALADGATRVMQKGNINREDLLSEVSAAIEKDGTQ
jgi:CheY-like chemotaxis protein